MTRLIVRVGYQGASRDAAWTVDATGHRWLFLVIDVDTVPTLKAVAEAVFVADNAPGEVTGLAAKVREAQARRIMDRPHHSFSVGDRVRVNGDTLICASSGWVRV